MGFVAFLMQLFSLDTTFITYTLQPVIQTVLKDLLLNVQSNVHHVYRTFPASLWSVVCASSEINSRFKVFNVTCTVRCTRFPVQ